MSSDRVTRSQASTRTPDDASTTTTTTTNHPDEPTRSRRRRRAAADDASTHAKEPPGSDGCSFQAEPPRHLLCGSFVDLESATEEMAQFAAEEGFQISVRTSTASMRYLGCRRGRYRRPTTTSAPRSTTAAASYTSYTGCPYSIKIAAHPTQAGRFALSVVKALHNHAPFPEGFDADAARRSRAAKRRLVQRQDSPTLSAVASTSLASSLASSLPAHPHQTDHDDHDEDERSEACTSLAGPRGVSHVRGGRSTAASNVSMRTDTSAARHLLSLSLSTAPAPAPAPSLDDETALPPRPSAAVQDDEVDDEVGAREAADRALEVVLVHPPFHSILSRASGLDHAQATRALAWAQALAKVLRIHLGLLHPDADTAIASLLADPPPPSQS